MIKWARLRASAERLAERVRVPGWARTALGVLILLVVVASFGRRVGRTAFKAREAWQPVSWAYVAVSFVSVLACLLAMALLWYGLLRTLGAKIPLLTAVRFYGLSLLPRYVPGMVWGYVGRTVLCERAGIARKSVVTSVLVEVAFVIGSGAILVTMNHFAWRWRMLLGLPGVILLLVGAWAGLTHRQRWVSRVRGIGIWYGWGLAYVAFWLLYGLSSWFTVLSIAPKIEPGSLPDVLTSTVLAWLGGFVVILVPSGLGIRESVFALTLTPLIGPAKGLLVPLIARLIGLSAEAAFFLCCVLLRREKDAFPGDREPT